MQTKVKITSHFYFCKSNKVFFLSKVFWYCSVLLVVSGSVLCVGSEWHRYPSSFFVPDYISEVRWIDDGFRGLLPFPFNSTLGGTAASPSYFNNKNQASDEQFVKLIYPSLSLNPSMNLEHCLIFSIFYFSVEEYRNLHIPHWAAA